MRTLVTCSSGIDHADRGVELDLGFGQIGEPGLSAADALPPAIEETHAIENPC